MKAKKEKDHSVLPSFEPYLITSQNKDTLETFEQILAKIFSETKNDSANPEPHTKNETVNEVFLIHLAHGIPAVDQYNPEQTPDRIKKWIALHIMDFPSRKNACLFFLNHFEMVTQHHNKSTKNTTSPGNMEQISPKNITNLLSFYPKNISDSKKKEKQIEAMVSDLKLFNLFNLMHIYNDYIDLGKPVPSRNPVLASATQLYKLIFTDLVSLKDDQKLLQKNIKIYLEVANKLLHDKAIIDLEGAGIISCVLDLKENLLENNKKNITLKTEIKKLSDIFNPDSNYKPLRVRMQTPNCIPLYTVISKDLIFMNENKLWNKLFLFGELYYDLSLKMAALRKETTKQQIFYPVYQTNLCPMLEGHSLFWSSVPRRENDLDYLPTLTCQVYVMTKNQLWYWNKTNNVYIDLLIKENELAKLIIKLNVQDQPINSSRLLSQQELKILSSFKDTTVNNQPMKTTAFKQRPRTSGTSLRHTLTIITQNPTMQGDQALHIHSAPTILHDHTSKPIEFYSSEKQPRKHFIRKTTSLSPISESPKIYLKDSERPDDIKLGGALIEYSHFSPPKSRRNKRHSDSVLIKSSSENTSEQPRKTSHDFTLTKK